MSTPLAGKFQDHYHVLGIEPKCDSETLQNAYAELARRYHPNNALTGDADAFAAVNAAYEVLSDPAQRLAFDNLKGVGEDTGCPQFSGTEFFESLGSDAGLRVALLCILYERRKKKPTKPGLSMRHIEAMLQADLDALGFVLWYTKQRGWVASDDKSNLLITVQGMDYLDSCRLSAAQVLPFIKPAAIARQEAQTNTQATALDGALANRAFSGDDAAAGTGTARTSPVGPN